MLLKLLPLALLTSTVLADGAAILNAISQISNDTIELQNTVSGWGGDLLGTLPIVAVSTKLLADIDAGAKVAQSSANLTLDETIAIVAPTVTLVSDVQAALAVVIAARKKFADLLLAPVILVDLELEKAATDKFSAAVVSKVPADLQAVAASLTAPVDTAFDYAIGNYTWLL